MFVILNLLLLLLFIIVVPSDCMGEQYSKCVCVIVLVLEL